MSRTYRANAQGHKKPERSPQPARAGTRRTAHAEALRTPQKASYDATGVAKLALDLSEELMDAIAQRTAELMASTQPEPWIGVEQAAEYLSCPKSRVYRLVSRRAIPFEKDGARVLFKRTELDAWVQAGGAK